MRLLHELMRDVEDGLKLLKSLLIGSQLLAQLILRLLVDD